MQLSASMDMHCTIWLLIMTHSRGTCTCSKGYLEKVRVSLYLTNFWSDLEILNYIEIFHKVLFWFWFWFWFNLENIVNNCHFIVLDFDFTIVTLFSDRLVCTCTLQLKTRFLTTITCNFTYLINVHVLLTWAPTELYGICATLDPLCFVLLF